MVYLADIEATIKDYEERCNYYKDDASSRLEAENALEKLQMWK
jgi:hypothetical protein